MGTVAPPPTHTTKSEQSYVDQNPTSTAPPLTKPSPTGGRRHPRHQIPRHRARGWQHGHAQFIRWREPGRSDGRRLHRGQPAAGQQPGLLRFPGAAAGPAQRAEWSGRQRRGRAGARGPIRVARGADPELPSVISNYILDY
jgi:hypothetical protein